MPEYTWICHICPAGALTRSWTTELAAQADAVWHTYLEHPDAWRKLVGNERPPQDAKPETMGQLVTWL